MIEHLKKMWISRTEYLSTGPKPLLVYIQIKTNMFFCYSNKPFFFITGMYMIDK